MRTPSYSSLLTMGQQPMLKHKVKHRKLIKLKQHENTSVFFSSDNGAATYAKTQAKTQEVRKKR